MSKTPKKKDEIEDKRTRAETERIAGKTLKTLLNTPPKPFTPPAKGKPKSKGVTLGDKKRG